MMHLVLPSLFNSELEEAIDYSIKKRFSDSNCIIDNNYKNVEYRSSISKLTQFILSRQPIITSYGCIFSKHANTVNPLYDLIEEFTTRRDTIKKEIL
jgi:hypothetical protein